VATNILSARLKKFVDLGIMTREPLAGHSGRHRYMLTEMGRDFFPAYLMLKKWGDDWLADPKGPQIIFEDRKTGKKLAYPGPLNSRGEPLRLEDVKIAAGAGAVKFNRERFGEGVVTADHTVKPSKRLRRSPGRSAFAAR
jgi:hypothetical protein